MVLPARYRSSSSSGGGGHYGPPLHGKRDRGHRGKDRARTDVPPAQRKQKQTRRYRAGDDPVPTTTPRDKRKKVRRRHHARTHNVPGARYAIYIHRLAKNLKDENLPHSITDSAGWSMSQLTDDLVDQLARSAGKLTRHAGRKTVSPGLVCEAILLNWDPALAKTACAAGVVAVEQAAAAKKKPAKE